MLMASAEAMPMPMPTGQRSGQRHAAAARRRRRRKVGPACRRRRYTPSNRHSVGSRRAGGALVVVSSLALVVTGMLLGGASGASQSAAMPSPARQHGPVGSRTATDARSVVRGRGRGRADASAMANANAMARPSGITTDGSDNPNDHGNRNRSPLDVRSGRRGSRHLKEDNNKDDKDAAAAVNNNNNDDDEDPDDDRVQACGLQWDRSVACGGGADKRDVVPVCCPGYACEGEWCVLPEEEKAKAKATEEPTPMPTRAPTQMPTRAPTELPTSAPTGPPPAAVLPAVKAVEVAATPSPVASSPTTATVPVPVPAAPTPPPQPAVPVAANGGLLSVPLGGPTTYTSTFPRASYRDVPALDARLLAEVAASFLSGRLLAVLDDRRSDHELIDGIDFVGVRMDVVGVRYENLEQDEAALREAGLWWDGDEDDNQKNNNTQKNNGKDNRNLAEDVDVAGMSRTQGKAKHRRGSQSDGRRRTQQAPAFSIGRPKAIVTLSGEARFRVTEPSLLVPAPPGGDNDEQQFVLADPADVPGPSTLWDLQRLIWDEGGASDDFLELLKLAGEASGDVVGTVSFVKIEQAELAVPTVPPTAGPTRGPTPAPVAAAAVVVDVDEEEGDDNVFVVVPPTDGGGMESAGGGDGGGGGGGFLPLEPDQPQETDEGSTFIPDTPGTSSGSTSKNTSNNANDSTAGIVIGVVAALVVGLAILAFFLVKRKRRLDASAELVDKARAEKIRREEDLSSGQQTPPNGSTSVNEDGIEVGYAAAGGAAASVAAGTAAGGRGSGGGWLSSKFLPKYLSPGRATKNRPDPNGQRPSDDNSSLGSSTLGNGTTDSKESWAKRVQSNISVGGSTLRGADDGSLGDDFSVGAESIGGKAAGPAFTGDDVENVGEIGMDDDVDFARGYDMARTETAQSTWSFSGVGQKRQDPPTTNPPNYGIAVAPQRSDVGNDDETEFSPDTRILNDDESALLEDDFDREFNRKPSDLTHISQGPGAIRPKQSGGRYMGGNLATHNETGSPTPPPPPHYSPPKKQSPTKLFAGSMLKRGGSSLRQVLAPQNQPTPSRANTGMARAASYGIGSKRDSFDDRGMGGSGIVRSSTSPTGSAGSGGTPTDIQRKRMEARRKMQMQMEYDAPSGGPSPRHASAGSSGGSDTRYREIKKSYSTQSDATEQTRNDNGETVLEDLNKLSGFLKERKEQQALQEGRGGSNERLGSHRTMPSSTSGSSGPKTVSSFMKDRGY